MGEKVNHFWQHIPGFFTFPEFYAWLADFASHRESSRIARDPARIVEVGVYTGQSVAYLGVELVNNGSDATIDLVDMSLASAKDNLRPIESSGVLRHWHEMNSIDAAKTYEVGSVDAVFIDADHGYDSVRRDIDAWLPKVKRGGIISGHDHCPDFPGVMQAVTETFPRYEVWRGERGPGWGDKRMQDTRQYYAVWSVRV